MHTQVRVYTVKPGELEAFVEEWRAQIVPLRARFSFEVQGAWASVEDDTFVWIVTYRGDDWEAAERAYYTSAERMAMEPDPARRITGPQAFMARPVPLS